jgi:hypothetical protein
LIAKAGDWNEEKRMILSSRRIETLGNHILLPLFSLPLSE